MTWSFWDSDAGFSLRPTTRRGRYRSSAKPSHPPRPLAIETLEGRCLLSGGIYEYPTGGSQPLGITAGPDGNLWFTEYGSDQVATMDVFGNLLAQQSLASGSHPWGITAGPNNYVWFAENGRNQIGRVNVDTYQLDEFSIHSLYTNDSQPMGTAADAAGRIWFAKPNAHGLGINNPDLSMCEIRFSADPFNGYDYPREITLGPDGRLWFTGYRTYNGYLGSSVGWISGDCSGSHAFVRAYYIPNPGFQGITAGPDGTVWVAEDNTNAIGHFDGDVSLLETIPIPTANSHPRAIITGPDGSLWFTEYGASQIGRITFDASGNAAITEYPTPTPDSGPLGITVGPDGNIWFTEYLANQVGQIVLDVYPLTATGLSLSATTGVPFTGTLASFSDTDPLPGPAANYSAVIDWGDGTSTSTGDINDNGGGNFDVIGGHSYAQAGSYTVTVTIADNDTDHDIGGVTTTSYSTVDVEDAGGGARQNRGIRLVEVAAALRAEPIPLQSSMLPIAASPAESAPAAAETLTDAPLPTSALEVRWAQENRPPAQHATWTAAAADRAAVPDRLNPETLDGLGVDLAL